MLPRAAKLYLAVIGAIVASAVVVMVTAAASGVDLAALAAASPKPAASPGSAASKAQAYCDTYVNHVAKNLGKSPDQVKKALQDARNQSLDDAVKAGDLTKQQADAIKAKQGSSDICSGDLARIGIPRKGDNMPAHSNAARVGIGEYAKVLGLTEQQLRQDLAAGKTVKDEAAAKGLSEADFRAKLADVVKADLDPRVAAGKLTQQQEDRILTQVKTGTLPFWDTPAKRPGAPGAPVKPTASPSTS